MTTVSKLSDILAYIAEIVAAANSKADEATPVKPANVAALQLINSKTFGPFFTAAGPVGQLINVVLDFRVERPAHFLNTAEVLSSLIVRVVQDDKQSELHIREDGLLGNIYSDEAFGVSPSSDTLGKAAVAIASWMVANAK